ncbi:MAG: hypothetical protein O7A67_05695 [SAR324 cluster bacterium]|nr:hypothetical protein [SAR324 cluster bacterium]
MAVLVAGLLLAACAESDDTKVETGPAPYTTATAIEPAPVTLDFGVLEVAVPQNAFSIGIVVQGTSRDVITFIEHRGTLLGRNDSIRGPGGKVPLKFNKIDGRKISTFVNVEAAAAHFPNDGTVRTLKAGTYKFPIGAADRTVAGTPLIPDLLTPFVYYKTATNQVPTLKVNLFVVEGVGGTIVDLPSAQSDPELMVAVQVLRNVYESNPNVAVTLDVTLAVIADPTIADIGSENEFFDLLSGFPLAPTHDAVNLFVVGSFSYLEDAVIGLAAGIPGPFNRQGTATSGTAMEYQGDGTGTILGFALAHELGHYFGLYHTSQTGPTQTDIIGEDPIDDTPACRTLDIFSAGGSVDGCPDRGNLMFPIVENNPIPNVTVGQGNVVKFNPAIVVP